MDTSSAARSRESATQKAEPPAQLALTGGILCERSPAPEMLGEAKLRK